ncbi:MAG: DUF7305 domain-containing protein [Opitutaceae bacterium]
MAVTFLKLASNEYSASVRSTLYASSLNLAESGVEMGIDALASKTTSGSTWTTTSNAFLTDASYTGDVKVVVLNASSRNPTIYAEGLINGHPRGAVKKQVRVELSRGFAPYEKGFSARNGITFNGQNVLLDSYNSNYGAYGDPVNGLAPFGYGYPDNINVNSDIWVASDTLSSTDGVTVIDAGNGDILGQLAVSPDNLYQVGPNGTVTDYETFNDPRYVPGYVDTSRVSEDFYADFPVPDHPTANTVYTVNEEVTVGRGRNAVTRNQDVAYSSISDDITITGSGTADNPATYAMEDISGGMITIDGHVALVMSGDIKLAGQSGIVIPAGSSLTIYTQDDIAISGLGVANGSGIPSAFNVYGTAAELIRRGEEVAAQSISISGNGELASAIYAPTADLTLNGGGTSGEVFGGVVAFTATLTGGSSFHFDEALRDIVEGDGSYTIESWLEMTGATTASTGIDMSAY